MRTLIWAAVALAGLALSTAAVAKPAPCVDVEESSAKELQALKGVGDVLAQRIVDYRQKERTAATKAGKKKWMFRNWATLMKVPGIGPKICQENVTAVCFSGKTQKACPK